jgi:hypothetical protein
MKEIQKVAFGEQNRELSDVEVQDSGDEDENNDQQSSSTSE